MVKFLLVLALALVAGTTSSTVPDRIIGGEIVDITAYPSVVQTEFWMGLAAVWQAHCGGSILTNFHILSAASCYSGSYSQYYNRRIRAGTNVRGFGGRLINLVRVTNHPSFNAETLVADITVVRLQNPLIFGPMIQRGSYINQGGVVSDGTPVVHVGWGRQSQGGAFAVRLHETTVSIVNNAVCAERYRTIPTNRIVTQDMICTGVPNGGRGACPGDYGGPVFFNNVIVGVASWSHNCGNATFPGVNTAVASYTRWILANAV